MESPSTNTIVVYPSDPAMMQDTALGAIKAAIMDTSLPSAKSVHQLVHGDPRGIPGVLRDLIVRFLTIGLGALLIGLRGNDALKAAIGGSVGIEVAVILWVLMTRGTTMPSSDTVARVMQGDKSAIPLLFRDFIARASFVGVGAYVAGLRDEKLIKAAFAGAFMIEISVVAWVYHNNKKQLNAPAVANAGI